MADYKQHVFITISDHPADLLANAAAVVRFLADTIRDEPLEQLSTDGNTGLYLILDGVGNTISAALAKID